MRVRISGVVVDKEAKEWEIGGRSGTSFSAYVRDGEDLRASAQRVRVSAVQFNGVNVGPESVVEWPVDVFANANDRGQARLTVTLAEDFSLAAAKGQHAPA